MSAKITCDGCQIFSATHYCSLLSTPRDGKYDTDFYHLCMVCYTHYETRYKSRVTLYENEREWQQVAVNLVHVAKLLDT